MWWAYYFEYYRHFNSYTKQVALYQLLFEPLLGVTQSLFEAYNNINTTTIYSFRTVINRFKLILVPKYVVVTAEFEVKLDLVADIL